MRKGVGLTESEMPYLTLDYPRLYPALACRHHWSGRGCSHTPWRRRGRGRDVDERGVVGRRLPRGEGAEGRRRRGADGHRGGAGGR